MPLQPELALKGPVGRRSTGDLAARPGASASAIRVIVNQRTETTDRFGARSVEQSDTIGRGKPSYESVMWMMPGWKFQRLISSARRLRRCWGEGSSGRGRRSFVGIPPNFSRLALERVSVREAR